MPEQAQDSSIRQFIKFALPKGWLNYYRRYTYSRHDSPFRDKSMPETFKTIFENNYWKGKESICGETSGIEQTRVIRDFLQKVCKKYEINTILDIPCGDFVWMNEVDLNGITYIGADIVPEMIQSNQEKYAREKVDFKVLDITSDALPASDLIICRDCLVHLSFNDIHKAIRNIINSGSKFLLCTSFIENRFNYDIVCGDWRTLNMQKAPFRFPEPLDVCNEHCMIDAGIYNDKAICLWRISELKY